MKRWTNEETFQFIELFKSEPVIWNPGHEYHKDRIMVKEAWSRIEKAMSIPMTELKRRKESLMTTFRLRHKQKLMALKLGKPNAFTNKWTFFDALDEFLKDIYELKSVTEMSENSITNDDSDHAEYLIDEEEEDQEVNFDDSILETKPKHKKRKRSNQNPLEFIGKNSPESYGENDFSYNHISPEELRSVSEDDCSLYGKLLAIKLRRLSEYERQELMYTIDGLILQRYRKRKSDSS